MAAPRQPLASSLPSEFIEVPSGGWSPDIPTWEMPANQAPRLENWQIKDGKLRVRPGYAVTTDLSATANQPSLAGWFLFEPNYFVLTKRLRTPTYQVEPQNVHRVGVSVPAGLTVVSTTTHEIIGNTVATVTQPSIPQVPGGRIINFNGARYTIGYANGPGAVSTYNDGVAGWITFVLQYNGSAASTVVSNSPEGGFDIYGGFNRIWVAGGQDPASVDPPSTTALFYSNPIQTLTGATTDWSDPVTGLYNQYDLDGDHSDAIVALASVPAGLIILRENSVFMLRGAADIVNSGTSRPVSKQVGCIDARSVVEQDSKVYFMSEQGFMVTDGVGVQNVSGPVQDELFRQVAAWNAAVFHGPGAYCTAASLSDSKILITFGINVDTGTAYQCSGTFSAIFDPATGAWVQITSQIGLTTGNFLGPVIAGYGGVYTLGTIAIATIEDHLASMSVSGTSSLYDKINVAGSFIPIEAVWETRSPSLALGSRSRVQMRRWYLDYGGYQGAAQDAQLTVSLLDRINGNGLISTFTRGLPLNSAGPHQYLQNDDQHEVADLGFQIIMEGVSSGAVSVGQAEVMGVGLDFAPASELHPNV